MISPGPVPAAPDARPRPLTIGVFDSGVGGLTVLRALFRRIPDAQYLYLGDTARLPYGSKSQETIARYAVESARFLVDGGADFLVIACNTASALALDAIRAAAAPVPVIGVIETGANAADATSATRQVLVIATAATVGSHAYRQACHERGLHALEKACPLLVPLVEEGWTDHPVTAEVLRIYLDQLFADTGQLLHAGAGNAAAPDTAVPDIAAPDIAVPDTLVLGCTHYPLLRPLIERTLVERSTAMHQGRHAPAIRVIDSAEVTAEQVAAALGLPAAPLAAPPHHPPACRFYATDSTARFRELGARFLAYPIEHVEHVDLGG